MSQMGRAFSNTGPGGFIQTLTGNSGGPVGPTAGNINVVGTGVISVVGNPGTSTLTITPSGSIASSFITNPATGTATPVLGVLTFAGTGGITVSAGGSTVTIDGSAIVGGIPWSIIAVDQTAAVDNGYFCNKAGILALTLPAVSVIGDVIEVSNENTAVGIQFIQAAGQQILIGNTNTTLGVGGTLASSAVGDTVKIVCKVANTIWRTTSMIGNWTII